MKKGQLSEELISYLRQGRAYFALPELAVSVIGTSDGYASFETENENKQTSPLYKIGSLTKLVTGLAILQLEEGGLLHLDDPVSMYLPWFNNQHCISLNDPISIVDLLLHTAGLPRGSLFKDNPAEAAIIALFSGMDNAVDQTGTGRFKYSNLGYIVLGFLIESVTKEAYSSFVKKRIFDPLGMDQSGFGIDDMVDQITVPHTLSYFSAESKNANDFNAIPLCAAPHASFDMHSSLSDFSTLIACLLNGGMHQGKNIFSPAAMANLFKINRQINSHIVSTIGLMRIDALNSKVYFQNAEHWGHSASVLIIPERKMALLAMTNRGSAGLDLWRLLQVAAGYLTRHPDLKYLNFNYAGYRKVTGEYRSVDFPAIYISHLGEQLFIASGTEERSPLIYKGRHVFMALDGSYKKYMITLDLNGKEVTGLFIGPDYYQKTGGDIITAYAKRYTSITGIYRNKTAGRVSLFERKGELILAYSPLKEAILTQTETGIFTQVTGPFENESIGINAERNELNMLSLTFKKIIAHHTC